MLFQSPQPSTLPVKIPGLPTSGPLASGLLIAAVGKGLDLRLVLADFQPKGRKIKHLGAFHSRWPGYLPGDGESSDRPSPGGGWCGRGYPPSSRYGRSGPLAPRGPLTFRALVFRLVEGVGKRGLVAVPAVLVELGCILELGVGGAPVDFWRPCHQYGCSCTTRPANKVTER